ncbi:MAG: aspartate/glutamate racemase family protein, partial [Marinoscillum sp.]
PYGRLDKLTLKRRVYQVIDHLRILGAEKVVIACHSASTIVKESKEILPIKDLSVQCAVNASVNSVGVIGGERTIKSRYYREKLHDKNIKVMQRVAQEFSIMVERGEIKSDYAFHIVHRIIHPLKDQEGLLLACTHYSALIPIIKQLFPHIKIIDPINDVYKYLKAASWLELNNDLMKSDLFVTTGDKEKMKSAAFLAFNCSIEEIKTIRL